MLSFIVAAAGLSLSGVSSAELGGTVLNSKTRSTFPSPVAITLTLHADAGVCLAETQADFTGGYVLTAPPGTYWLTVSIGNQETWTERVQLAPGSHTKHLSLQAPWDPGESPLLVLAKRS